RPLEWSCHAILSLWTGTHRYIGWSVDPRPHIRFRRPHHRYRRAHLPFLGRGLRGPWGASAVRSVGQNRRLVEQGIRPPTPPRATARPPAGPRRARPADPAEGRARPGPAAPTRSGRPRGGRARQGLEGGGGLELVSGLGARP